MRVTGKVLLVLSLLAVAPAGLAAQVRSVLDLTEAGGSRQVSPGKIQVKIINMIPGIPYTINAKIQTVDIQPFSVSSLGIQQGPVAAPKAVGALADPCGDAAAALQKGLADAKTEEQVKAAIDSLRTSNDFRTCSNKTAIEGMEATIESNTTRLVDGSFPLAQGQELVVDVKRKDPIDGDGTKEKSWTFTLTTGVKGAWLIHYGFSFLSDHDRTYFAKEDKASATTAKADGDAAAATTYTITRKTDHSGLKGEPSVVLSYVPARFQSRDWFPAFTAGLGVDLNNPFVFFGGSLLVGDNVNVFLGAAVHREKRLNGKYHEKDPLTENLSEDQLTDNVLKPALVFGVGFRFDGNPFKKSTGSDTKGNETKK